MPHGLAVGRALPLNDLGNERLVTEKDVGEEDAGDDHERQAERPVGRNQHDDQSDRGDHQIPCRRQTGAIGNRFLEKHQIETGNDAKKPQNPVIPGDVTARARLEQGIGHAGQEQRKGEMNRARGIRIERYVDARQIGQQEGNVGGVVELKQRPDKRKRCHENADRALWIARARVALCHQLLKVDIRSAAVRRAGSL